jgi:hypothetical protein
LFGSQAPWWFDPASNFFAVVLGAIIGGVISFVLSRRASKEVLDRDAAARSDQRKAAVFRLSVSLIVTVGVLGTLRAHLKEQLSKAGDPAFRQRELWELVKPMAAAASDEIPTFDIEGLSILFEDNELDLMQQLILFRRRCAADQLAFIDFCHRRADLAERLPAPVLIKGNIASVRPSPEQVLALKPFTIPLNNLLEGLSKNLETDWRMAMELSEKFTLVARKHLAMPGLTLAVADPFEPKSTGSESVAQGS